MRRIESPADVEAAIAGEAFLDEEDHAVDLRLNDAEMAAFHKAKADGYLVALSETLPSLSPSLLAAWEWWCVVDPQPNVVVQYFHDYATVALQWVAWRHMGTEGTDAALQRIQALLDEAAQPTERRPMIDARVESHGTEVFAVAAVPTGRAVEVAQSLRHLTRDPLLHPDASS